MKVFGIGLSRTGSTSLSNYLNANGFKIKHYPRSKKEVFEYRDGAIDIPVIKYYKELDHTYRDAKFVYTFREKDSWMEAIEHYFKKKEVRGDKLNKWQIEHREYVYDQVKFNYDVFSAAYDRHHQDVTDYFHARPNDFLIVNIVGGEDTGSLNKFLGLDREPCPYPRDNKKDRRWDNQMKKS